MIRIMLLAAAALCLCAQPKSDFKITVQPKAPLTSNAEVPVEILIKDTKGAAVSGAQVEVVATMIDMDHGEFKYTARQTKPGIYEIKPGFVMDGTWKLAVKATKNGKSGSMDQKVEVK